MHTHTHTSPDNITHNQTDYTLLDKTQNSSILNVRPFQGADSDTDHILVARLFVSKGPMDTFHRERFDLTKTKHGS
jgi:hypothetical protein